MSQDEGRPPLTQAEQDLLDLLTDGAAMEAIMFELGLSIEAVLDLEHNLVRKLSVGQKLDHSAMATPDPLELLRHLRSGHGYTGPADKSLATLKKVHGLLHVPR